MGSEQSKEKPSLSGKSDGFLQSWYNKFELLRPLLRRVIGGIVKPDDIEDIVQDTFVNSYAAARNQKVHNPPGFMLRTARNLALNQAQRAYQKLDVSFDEESVELAGYSKSLESEYQSREEFLAFCCAVAQLPVNCRKVFILKKVYGLTQKEIAEYLNISTSTVEKHVSKGMTMIAKYMIKKGHSEVLNGGFHD